MKREIIFQCNSGKGLNITLEQDCKVKPVCCTPVEVLEGRLF